MTAFFGSTSIISLIRQVFTLAGICLLTSATYAQIVQSPAQFLGYDSGEQFTYHHKAVSYLKHVAQASPRVQYVRYGTSYEGRELGLVIITAPQHAQKLERIRLNHLRACKLIPGKATESPSLPIVWLSYNVHGNEAACTEAALVTLYKLATGQGDTTTWLDKSIVILDPCLNPDGQARYVQGFRQRASIHGNPDSHAWEHKEPWPTGRFNHYLFDLNRDWCWQTQTETRQRLSYYRNWMPHVHADFHEMGHNASYFFAPAAKPYHKVITPWQIKFQEDMGENHTRYFNKNNWRFFTGEVYDLFYPSYGDTWPMFTGTLGFTYEQAGSGDAGLSIARPTRDTLSLQDRISHHVVTGFSTLEASVAQADKLIEAQVQYFDLPLFTPPGPYTSFVIKQADRAQALNNLSDLLDRLMIQHSRAGKDYAPTQMEGYSYRARNQRRFNIEEGDLIITTRQPQGRLVKVLFEPEAQLEDSLTYDLTAWSLPYAYGLETYGLTQVLNQGTGKPVRSDTTAITQKPYALLIPWRDISQANFLSAALQAGLQVRYATTEGNIKDYTFTPGTLAILAGENDRDFAEVTQRLAYLHDVSLFVVPTGRMAKGSDLGSESWRLAASPRVALITGPGMEATAVGDLWYYFEQVLRYPVTLISTEQLDMTPLYSYHTIIIPDGNMKRFQDKFMTYTQEGGHLILLEGGLDVIEVKDKDNTTVLAQAIAEAARQKPQDGYAPAHAFGIGGDSRSRSALSNRVTGSIYEITLNPSHTLSYGYDSAFFLIKRNNRPFPLLPDVGQVSNVGIFGTSPHVSGFAGGAAKPVFHETLAIGEEYIGEGKATYFLDPPIFRGFWRSGELMLANALFFR